MVLIIEFNVPAVPVGQPRPRAVNAGAHYDDKASVDYLARRFAKMGVNMVRVHSGVFDRNARDPGAVDRKYLDQLHYFVASTSSSPSTSRSGST